MPAIYQADCYCDSCADQIREAIIAATPSAVTERFLDERDYDSDEFPKWMSDDEPTDSPCHCGSGEDCLKAETLSDGRKIGALLSTSLTEEGVAYTEAEIAKGGEVAIFWYAQFSNAGVEFDRLRIADHSRDFGDFFQGYCMAMCFTACEEDGDGLFLSPPGDFKNHWDCESEVLRLLDSSDLQEIKLDCADFFLDHRGLFNGKYEQAGGDFHLSRNGQGAGFFDGAYDGYEQVLQQAAKRYGSLQMYGHLADGTPCDAYLMH